MEVDASEGKHETQTCQCRFDTSSYFTLTLRVRVSAAQIGAKKSGMNLKVRRASLGATRVLRVRDRHDASSGNHNYSRRGNRSAVED